MTAPALSEREMECLLGAAEGEEARDTAERLHLSQHTVKHHRQNLLHKLRAHTVTQAVATAYHTGIFKPQPVSLPVPLKRGSIVAHPETGLEVYVAELGEKRARCIVLDVDGRPSDVEVSLPLWMIEKWDEGRYGPDKQ